MPRRTAAVLLLHILVRVAARTKNFPPGWNGLARTPPMGWRSWNTFGNNINHSIIEANMKAITDKKWTVHGHNAPVSARVA